MKLKRPDYKDIIIFVESLIIFYFLFHYWDEVKSFIVRVLNL